MKNVMTKFKGRMPAKRKGRGGARKGAGRPRKAKRLAKTHYINIRIKQETRRRIEAEARQLGKPKAEVTERLLEAGLRASKQDPKNREVEALLFLIGMLARTIPGSGYANKYATDPRYNWLTSPFMFKAFRTALMLLVDTLQPPGEIVAPPTEPLRPPLSDIVPGPLIHRIHFPVLDTPERRGREAAITLLSHLKDAGMKIVRSDAGIPPPLHDVLTEELTREVLGAEVAVAVARVHNGLSDALRALAAGMAGVAK
jgi:hypothetical protein